MRAVFDGEWEAVLDEAKESKDLEEVRDLLRKWRHLAHAEMIEPGSYYAVQAKAELIQRTGVNPNGVPVEDVRALIARRLAQ